MSNRADGLLPEGPDGAGHEAGAAHVTLSRDRRRANLRAALGFLQLPPRSPELRLLHRWLDSWTGLGLVVVGVERQGLRFSLTHIADDEWRATFMAHPMFSPAGFAVAATPWEAVQQAAWTTLKRA